ncbi:MAG: peptidyl-prolyl cis-trans isomerase [Planctomycetota bacterium]
MKSSIPSVASLVGVGWIVLVVLLAPLGNAQESPIERLPDDPAAVIAYVGTTPILLGELLPKVDARIDEVVKARGQEIPAAERDRARVALIRNVLAQRIPQKVMRESFLLDQVGTQSTDKRLEAEKTLTARARQMFHDQELPDLMKQYEAESIRDLDSKLRSKGTSLIARENEFIDTMLGHLYIRSNVDRDPKISLADVNEYYETHRSEFEHPARARWEQLTVLFERFPDRKAAVEAINTMGNEAFFGGSIAAVAREKSQEPFASDGGLHEWTSRGSLASEVLENEIFTMDVGLLSRVLEDASGLHIIRVLEREEAGVTPLSQVQDEIRAKIRKRKVEEAQQAVMVKIQGRVPVWSIFPNDVPGALPLLIASEGTNTLR